IFVLHLTLRLACANYDFETSYFKGAQNTDSLHSILIMTCTLCLKCFSALHLQEQFMCGEVIDAPTASETKLEVA
uniref:Uncharacterized protein n=1 Tax=Astyanax mexicanus TaxID=7994 RepID=A0A8B9GRT4_ASTMX